MGHEKFPSLGGVAAEPPGWFFLSPKEGHPVNLISFQH